MKVSQRLTCTLKSHQSFGIFLACADGFYGRNCRLMCKCIEKHQDRACNQMNGRCHCLSNYTGLRCELLKTEPMETPTQSANRAAIIAGATVGGALVLLLLIILVVVITVAVIILVVHLRKRKYVRLRVSLSQLFENQTQQSESLVIEPLKFEPLETSSGQDLEESSSSLPGVPLHFRPIGSDHRRESDQYLWKPSTPAYSSASFFVTNKASTIEWKGHGLKIHIPDSSLAPSLVPRSSHAQLKVDVHTLASELGSGCVPVSSLYSVRMGAGKLCKPVTIEFQHCLDVSDAVHISELVILRAADVTKDFEPIDGAVFDRETGCGKVTVPRLNDINQEYDDFSWFVVALRRLFLPSTICYKARVYMYTSKGTTKMYFIVTMALEMCTTVCGLIYISVNNQYRILIRL